MTTKKKLAIIDADGLLFYAAWEFRDKLTNFGAIAVKAKVDQIISSILRKTGADYYLGFFGTKSSITFRHDFATIKPYKGSRKTEPWQEYYKPLIKEHYAKKWGFYGLSRLEADDAVVIAYHQYKDKYDLIMVGEDKDMHQMGEFTWYNPKNNESKDLNYEEGRKFYWCQHIEGDGADNIGGIPGEGKKSKLKDLINELEPYNEEDAFNMVRDFYINKHGEDYLYHLIENHILLTMMVKPCFDYPKEIEFTKVEKFESKLKKLDI
jgi:5'-3' exonuclease